MAEAESTVRRAIGGFEFFRQRIDRTTHEFESLFGVSAESKDVGAHVEDLVAFGDEFFEGGKQA